MTLQAPGRSSPPANYPILLSNCGSAYELRVPQLSLRVQAKTLQEAYAELLVRRSKVVEYIDAVGVRADLPPATAVPQLRSALADAASPAVNVVLKGSI